LTGGWFARRFSFGQVIAGTLTVQALMLPLLAFAPSSWALAAAFAVLMFCGPLYTVVQLSRRLAMIPDGLQGRVNSAFRFAANVLYPVGVGVCGVLAEHLGPVVAALAFTAVAASLAVVARLSPVVWLEGRGPA
jgi:predicted MFS family arabinose efflux permease